MKIPPPKQQQHRQQQHASIIECTLSEAKMRKQHTGMLASDWSRSAMRSRMNVVVFVDDDDDGSSVYVLMTHGAMAHGTPCSVSLGSARSRRCGVVYLFVRSATYKLERHTERERMRRVR